LSEQTQERRKSKEGPNIYDLLKKEHKDVKKLFKQIVDSERYDDTVYMQIKKALQVHMAGEEKLLYPRLENEEETRNITLEAYEEHDVGKQIMNDIDMSNKSEDDRMLAKVKVLSETIDMHVKEEEDELFKKAKKVLSHEDEREIGRLYEENKMASTK
jgi:hemerythrin-like domain-containing protein